MDTTPKILYSHGKMGSQKGRFQLRRKDIEEWFSSSIPYHQGRQELPQPYSQLRMDFDWSIEGTEAKPLYNMDDFLIDFDFITSWLMDNLKNNNEKLPKKYTKAVFLTKEPYVKDGKVKHGLHIQFPYIFLSKEHFRAFEEEIKPHFDAMDSICGKPWLMYGQSKGYEYKPYKYAFTYYNKTKYEDFKKAFVNYKVYNDDEEEQPLTLKRLLSINSFGRVYSQEYKPKTIVSIQEAKVNVYEDFEDEEIQKIASELVPLLSPSRADDYNEWMNVGFCLYSLLKGTEIGLELWKDFSQGCQEKYDESSCEYNWYRMTIGNFTIGTLRHWARQDNEKLYFEWVKTSSINKVYKKREENTSLNVSSHWYNTVYKSYTKNKYSDNETTYGQICEEDSSFAIWCVKNKIIPHARRFADILGIEYNNFPSIKADEIINKNDIGSYSPAFSKADVVAIRSNMMTYKTVQTVKYIEENPKMKVLHITFRISLARKHCKDLRELGFMLYSDSMKGTIKDDRVIVQLDSLHRVRGKYDLIILDEVEAIKEHLFARTIKDRKKIWNCLEQHLSCKDSKILLSDALLVDETVEWVQKMSGKKTWVIDNKWKSFKDQKCHILPTLSSSEMALRVLDYMKSGEKIFFPCNNKGYLKRISYLLSQEFKDKKIGVACQDNRIPEEDWGDYDFLGISPTYVAGNSFSQRHFTRCIGFFQNNTCTAEMSSQMIRRVRHTEKDMEICFSKPLHYYLPTTYKAIDKWLINKDEVALHYGFNIDYINNKLIKDDYYEQVIHNNLKKNRSYMGFDDIFIDILKLHGVKVYFDGDSEDIDKEKCKEYDTLTQHKLKFDRKLDMLLVSKAEDITHAEAERIQLSQNATKEEQYMLRKYRLQKTYNISKITPEIVEHLEKKQGAYTRYCKMVNPTWNIWVKNNAEMLEKEKLMTDNTERLHKQNDSLVCYALHKLLKGLGFDGAKCDKTVECFPYKKAIKYLNLNEQAICLCMGKKYQPLQWNSDELKDDKYRRKVSLKVNDYLKHIGVGIKRVLRNNSKVQVKSEPWKEYGIEIKTNTWMGRTNKVERLMNCQGVPL